MRQIHKIWIISVSLFFISCGGSGGSNSSEPIQ